MYPQRAKAFGRGFMAAAAIAGVLAGGAAAEAKTFKWAFQGDVQTLDPHGLFETFTLGFQSNFYEGLVTRSPDLQLQPALATSWENVEPTVWRFTLRQGVKFHNGSSFNADDVIFSVERIRTEGSDMKVIAGLIKEAVKVDDFTVDLVTERTIRFCPCSSRSSTSWTRNGRRRTTPPRPRTSKATTRATTPTSTPTAPAPI